MKGLMGEIQGTQGGATAFSILLFPEAWKPSGSFSPGFPAMGPGHWGGSKAQSEKRRCFLFQIEVRFD
jgi:hypothetical protein